MHFRRSVWLILTMLLILHLPLRAQSLLDKERFSDSLFTYYLGVVQKAISGAGGSDEEGYYSVDPLSHDTIFVELDLRRAVNYLEAVTNIYMPRSKMGNGVILNEAVVERWKQYYASTKDKSSK